MRRGGLLEGELARVSNSVDTGTGASLATNPTSTGGEGPCHPERGLSGSARSLVASLGAQCCNHGQTFSMYGLTEAAA